MEYINRIEQLYDLSPYQWIAFVASLIYIYFAVKNKPICFIFGIIASGFWAYESFYVLNLKFDAGLQIFYVLMSGIGIYSWLHGGREKRELPITRFTWIQHTIAIVAGIIVTVIIGYLGSIYLDTVRPILDSITTGFSIIATVMLVRRIIDNWIYLVICDILYIYIYGSQGAILFVIMMVIYAVMGVWGYINWKKLMNVNGVLTQ